MGEVQLKRWQVHRHACRLYTSHSNAADTNGGHQRHHWAPTIPASDWLLQRVSISGGHKACIQRVGEDGE